MTHHSNNFGDIEVSAYMWLWVATCEVLRADLIVIRGSFVIPCGNGQLVLSCSVVAVS